MNISRTKIDKKLSRKENPALAKLVILLKKQKKPIWITLANLLVRPKRKAVSVNILKINKLTKANDTVVIPGKILSEGTLNHNLTIAAFKFSASAKQALSKSKLITIEELLKQNPQGKGVKIII